MPHLDEGTIHAWLDGELSAADAAAAERHVADCPKCQAVVADARGAIAGAARIVSALDAGPPGVIPRPASQPNTKTSKPRFAGNPVRMAMAATIIVAVGVTLSVRELQHDRDPRSAPRLENVSPTLPVRSAPVPTTSTAAAPASAVPEPKAPDAFAAKAQTGALPTTNAPAPAAAPTALADKKALDAETAIASRPDSNVLQREVAKDIVAGAAVAKVRDRALSPDSSGESAFQGCYQLAVDSTTWRGVVPAAFELDRGSAAVGGVIAAQTAERQKVAGQPANAVRSLAAAPQLAFAVHRMSPTGRIDSASVGEWSPVGPRTVLVRFVGVDRGRSISVIFAPTESSAQVISFDRTDSLRLTKGSCPR